MTGGSEDIFLDVPPKDMTPEPGLEKELYNAYYIVSDSKFLEHMRQSIPVLAEHPDGKGSAYYPPLILNRYALGLAQERIAGRKSNNSHPDIEKMIALYSSNESSDPLVSLINTQLGRYKAHAERGGMHSKSKLEAWQKLNNAKALYFREKAQAYKAGVDDAKELARQHALENKMDRRFRRLWYAVAGLAAVLFIGAPTALFVGGRLFYDNVTQYTDDKFKSSTQMFDSRIGSAIATLEGYEGKFREIINEDILPQIRSGQMSPETMRKIDSLIELADDPEVKEALKLVAKLKAAAAKSAAEKEEKEENPKSPKSPKSGAEEEY